MKTYNNTELNDLALEVLDNARSRLLMNLRFMDTALSFHERTVYEGSMASAARRLSYDPVWVLRTYRDSANDLTRTYLHTVLHCVFCNPFSAGIRDRRLWDLACDIAAESTACELDLVCTRTERDADQTAVIRRVRREAGYLTAEKIYSWLAKCGASDKEIAEWEILFKRDDHSVWYIADEDAGGNESDGSVQMMNAADRDPDAERKWKDMAERIEMDVEMFAKVKGKYASSLVQNLRAVNRERYDYSEFLRKFSASHEKIRVSEDEFDYIYYSYGLRHYGNMPLIEPLEYRNDSKIHDFVIVIDTSGSVAGEEVQQFLQKTYNILRSRESFGRKINMHIIQCDAKVQSDSVITSPEDFDRYIDTMEIRGLGGTDFRPVFDYIDDLIASGDLSDMRGLIYFTDGLGTYPSEKPDYRTAFVFVESGYNIPEVPPWAMKLVLQPGEI